MKYTLQLIISAFMVAGGLSLLGWHSEQPTVWGYIQALIGVWFIMFANETAQGLSSRIVK